MFKIEFYRFYYSQKYLYIIIITGLIILLNYVLSNVFELEQNQQVLSYFNSFTQFTFLLIPPIFATSINEDYIKGYYAFFRQQGYTRKQYFISKIIIVLLISVFIALIFLAINYKFPEIKIVTLLLLANLIIIFSICLFASFVFIKPLYSILAVYIYFFLGSIANFSNLNTGTWLLPDKNSIASAYVSNLYSYPWDNRNINEISSIIKILFSYSLTIIFLLLISYLVYLLKLNKRYF